MIDTDAAKAWMKVETSDEDTMIGALLAAAIGTVEKATGKNLSVKDFAQVLAGFPCRYPYTLPLWQGPVVAISRVEYDPADGGEPVELTDFRLVEGLNGALLPAYGAAAWPLTLAGPGTVRISGTAGFSDDEAPELDQACLMLVAHWYQNREAVVAGDRAVAVELPLGVEMLIRPYRPSGLL